jgi:hypothetical protein
VKYQPFAVDALPPVIQETFSNLSDELASWLTPENAAVWTDCEVILEFDNNLGNIPNIVKIKYLSLMLTQQAEDVYLAAGRLLSAEFSAFYFGWLAMRLTEAMCIYAGNNLLRAGQERMAARWEQVSKQQPRFYVGSEKANELLHFLFTTLIPQVYSIVGHRKAQQTTAFSDLAEQFTQQAQQARERQEAKPKGRAAKVPKTLPQTVETLCCSPFTPAYLRQLLTKLEVVDAETGHWHLGELKGKAAAPKSAFPAAYRALAEARLLLQTDAPVYRQLFEQQFGVELSDRTANFKEGNGSLAFHDYLARARYWIKIWKSKL